MTVLARRFRLCRGGSLTRNQAQPVPISIASPDLPRPRLSTPIPWIFRSGMPVPRRQIVIPSSHHEKVQLRTRGLFNPVWRRGRARCPGPQEKSRRPESLGPPLPRQQRPGQLPRVAVPALLDAIVPRKSSARSLSSQPRALATTGMHSRRARLKKERASRVRPIGPGLCRQHPWISTCSRGITRWLSIPAPSEAARA